MRKRLPLFAACLALAAFGASACGSSDDGGSGSSSTPKAAASESAPVTAPGSPSASPADVRGLKGVAAKLYLKTIRDHYPDLDRVSDDELVAHGDALCLAQGQDLVDQAKKTKRELELTGKQASRILGTAHGMCGRNAFG
ncbi:hypothetical protein ABT390_12485 [Streptomyces aurantiacus]|uniref:DUF732 domain-containing protein n=1 Tax=Streptomyces aurantiacus JA 4570 TaxID=1286094 RepID=S4ARU1_9ACTN|nr:hypothetical protein [Streptomyces aurantiacus]EPH44132.1 hypothetical protein STRAU_2810 [Streptomyces aurantiacus JA 4570]